MEMNNDIVYRLRYKQRIQEPWFAHKEPLFGDAADEIEKLRAALNEAHRQLDQWQVMAVCGE